MIFLNPRNTHIAHTEQRESYINFLFALYVRSLVCSVWAKDTWTEVPPIIQTDPDIIYVLVRFVKYEGVGIRVTRSIATQVNSDAQSWCTARQWTLIINHICLTEEIKINNL